MSSLFQSQFVVQIRQEWLEVTKKICARRCTNQQYYWYYHQTIFPTDTFSLTNVTINSQRTQDLRLGGGISQSL